MTAPSPAAAGMRRWLIDWPERVTADERISSPITRLIAHRLAVLADNHTGVLPVLVVRKQIAQEALTTPEYVGKALPELARLGYLWYERGRDGTCVRLLDASTPHDDLSKLPKHTHKRVRRFVEESPIPPLLSVPDQSPAEVKTSAQAVSRLEPSRDSYRDSAQVCSTSAPAAAPVPVASPAAPAPVSAISLPLSLSSNPTHRAARMVSKIKNDGIAFDAGDNDRQRERARVWQWLDAGNRVDTEEWNTHPPDDGAPVRRMYALVDDLRELRKVQIHAQGRRRRDFVYFLTDERKLAKRSTFAEAMA